MEQQQHVLMKKTNGLIAILWDMENCPVPRDVRPEDAAGNITMALRAHPKIKGAVNMFSAYGDFHGFSQRLREGCQRTGVKLIDVPNGRKDAADKAILVDMFLFALDNPPPSSIMLISGDVDFSHALHVLGQRGYTVILVIPSGVGVSSALSNAGSYVWDWPSLVRGEGSVPPSRSRDLSGFLMGLQIVDNPDAKRISMVSEFNTSLVSTSKSSDLNDVMWVQPGDSIDLKGQVGMPKKKRKKAVGEVTESRRKLKRVVKIVTSVKCKKEGHNSRTCKGQALSKSSDLKFQPGDLIGLKGQVGSPKKKGKTAVGEVTESRRKLKRVVKTVTCVKCKKEGHNSRTCKVQALSKSSDLMVQPGDLIGLKGQVGSPKKKGNKAVGEVTESRRMLKRVVKTVTCVKCKKEGHNSRTCKGQALSKSSDLKVQPGDLIGLKGQVGSPKKKGKKAMKK